MLTPEQIYDKYQRRIKQSLQDMEAGVNGVTKSPMEAAAAKADKWLLALQEAASNGRWQRGLKAISLDTWKRLMKEKGIPRIATGVDNAKEKTIDFYEQLQAFQAPILAQLEKMPDNNLEDSIQRQNYWVREMAKFQLK